MALEGVYAEEHVKIYAKACTTKHGCAPTLVWVFTWTKFYLPKTHIYVAGRNFE